MIPVDGELLAVDHNEVVVYVALDWPKTCLAFNDHAKADLQVAAMLCVRSRYRDSSNTGLLQVVANGTRAAGGDGEQGRGLDLYDCLELFHQPEELSEENMWYCNKCKDHVQAGRVCMYV